MIFKPQNEKIVNNTGKNTTLKLNDIKKESYKKLRHL
jgi:hypothetical protein